MSLPLRAVSWSCEGQGQVSGSFFFPERFSRPLSRSRIWIGIRGMFSLKASCSFSSKGNLRWASANFSLDRQWSLLEIWFPSNSRTENAFRWEVSAWKMMMAKASMGGGLNVSSGTGSGRVESGEEWEMRPGGMLVQKRNPDLDRNAAPPPPKIRVGVKHGSIYHEISISSAATFGKL